MKFIRMVFVKPRGMRLGRCAKVSFVARDFVKFRADNPLASLLPEGLGHGGHDADWQLSPRNPGSGAQRLACPWRKGGGPLSLR